MVKRKSSNVMVFPSPHSLPNGDYARKEEAFNSTQQIIIFTKNITMCNFMGIRVTKVQFIQLRQIEKQLGTLAALRELQLMKDGFTYSNSLIIRKLDDQDVEVVAAH